MLIQIDFILTIKVINIITLNIINIKLHIVFRMLNANIIVFCIKHDIHQILRKLIIISLVTHLYDIKYIS